ncbi:MAG: ImmA/IrrE family metallo-endopeptidase [Silicimonas sp.]|nr:ImmA/IrrE family metallo-endopeptidase [Silicimonas sp.]
MKLNRIELADIHSPKVLARILRQQLGDTGPRADIFAVAKALDIDQIELDIFDGFEGMLLTDRVRSRGAILANTRHGMKRVRFTVAHELGHFLLEKHALTDTEGFRCRSQDMQETLESRQELKQETQANQFAIEFLAPAPKFEFYLSEGPDLKDAETAGDVFGISLEASVRRLVDLRPEALAAVWSHKGRIRYHHRANGFPWINRKSGTVIASTTPAFQAISTGNIGISNLAETHPTSWTDTFGLDLWEQTRVGYDGHAVTLLWAERPESDGAENDEFEELGMPRFR